MNEAESSETTFAPADPSGALRQGEILSGVLSLRTGSVPTPFDRDAVAVGWWEWKWAVVVSQDCDLEQDFNERKQHVNKSPRLLSHVLLCPADPEADVKGDLGMNSRAWDKEKYQRVFVIRGVDPAQDAVGAGIPRLACDFKRYFAVETALLYGQLAGYAQRRAVLRAIYAAQFSARFFNFQSRIALPVGHED